MTPGVPSTRFGPLAGGLESTPTSRSYWVVERRLLAGGYPFAGDSRRGRRILQTLVDAGIVTFVDLTEAGTDAYSDGHLTPYAAFLPSDRRHVPRPTRDMGVPTIEEMKETLDLIDAALDRNEATYVHCWGGVGRTGTVIACWMMRHGVADHDDVLDRLATLRHADAGAGGRPAPESSGQREFLLAWPVGG